MRALVALAVVFATVADASAYVSCGRYDFAGPFAAALEAGVEFEGAQQATETIMTLPDAVCHQDRLLARLAWRLGPTVGYKAAATSPGAQRALGLDAPVLGTLLRDMILPDGSDVAIADGAHMIYELDLLARVGPAGLAGVTDRASALEAIDALLPFIELGDLMLPKGVAITGPLLQAMNAGARAGAAGAPVPTAGMTEDDIAGISGVLTLGGAVVAEAPATALLGHPLQAVVWIAEATRARSIEVKPGDLLSLGSMGKFQTATPGLVRADYRGLPGGPASVSVTLR